MKNAQKPDHVSLGTLIGNLKQGRFVIPDFQRDFEWSPQDIRDLMRSIFLDYYIGSLLLWKGKPETFNALACEQVYGYEESNSNPEHIVLDGQQRLTAIYYALVAPNKRAPNRSNRCLYFVNVRHFIDGAYDDAFFYDWRKGGLALSKDQVTQFRTHTFPLSVVGSGGWDLANWVQGYETYWQERALQVGDDPEAAIEIEGFADDAREFGILLKDLTEQYQIAYVELDEDLTLDKVCDIFTQVNSKGIRLDVFDLINALVKPRGLQLKHMWREASPKLEFVSSGSMNVYILQVMSIMAQAYCSPKYLYYLLPGQEKTVRDKSGVLSKQILVEDSDAFKSLWDTAVASLQRAMELLRHPQDFGAISSGYLPYVSILPVFAALQHEARSLPPTQILDASKKIRHWYWSSVFLSRYSGSVESTAARDFTEVSAWFGDDEKEPALISEFKQRFNTLPLRDVKSGSSVYNGIFNLLVISEARDWMTGDVPQHDDLDDHHIVPRDWSKGKDLPTSIDTILNRTPLTAATNRYVISNRLPCTYLPELIKKNGEAMVRGTLESHLISPAAFDILLRSPFTTDDFEAFISERQRTILEAIEDLLIKARLGLPPQLRELDVQIETVELALRTLIDEALDGDISRIPSQVREKVQPRVAAAITKGTSPAEQDQSLPGQLEFFDLRELQDTITNKALWPLFEDLFRQKEALGGHFNHLANLRNAIRHSRTADQVTRSYGEAALLWFTEVLA
jgi:hypothetical protein